MSGMSDPDEEDRSQQQEGETAVDDVLDSALSHDRAREHALEEGNLEQKAREESDNEA